MKFNTLPAVIVFIIASTSFSSIAIEASKTINNTQSSESTKSIQSSIDKRMHSVNGTSYVEVKKKNDALECTNAELKRYIDVITNPIQQKIDRIKTPEEKCYDWTQMKQVEKGEKGLGGCVTQVCGRLPNLDFGSSGFGGLMDMLRDPMAALSKKLSQKLQDAWQKAKCSIIEIPTKALQGIVTEGERAMGDLNQIPGRAIDSFVDGVDKTVSKTIDKSLRDNKYIGPIMKYSGSSGVADGLNRGSQGIEDGIGSLERDIADFGSGVYDYLDDK